MGVGEFLSSKAENEWILNERRREQWELESYPAGEIREVGTCEGDEWDNDIFIRVSLSTDDCFARSW